MCAIGMVSLPFVTNLKFSQFSQLNVKIYSNYPALPYFGPVIMTGNRTKSWDRESGPGIGPDI